ncbi:MAG: hypothetical protein HY806_08955 [Nitrospirae bacterium]|nr:hypothetical protein [Nitrospirota bacterium]
MIKRYALIFASALIIALVAVFISAPGSYDFFRFKMGNYDIRGETASVKDAIKLFSASISGFYASGGNPAGLNMFPAEKLIKRRIFMDINYAKKAGQALVMDRDKSDIKQITFMDPVRAVAVVNESWFNEYQDYETRKKLSNKKANIITVRYFLKKMWSKWIVVEYEVFGRDDKIPPVPVEWFVRI